MGTVYEFSKGAFPWLVIGLLLAIYFGMSTWKTQDDKTHDNYGLTGMCMGMCLGISFKEITGSIGTGISVGMLGGLIIGSMIEKKG